MKGYVALLIDSEEPLSNIDETWDHLMRRDRWQRPRGAQDDQVLFMTTCMETWIVADYNALRAHFGQGIQRSAYLLLTISKPDLEMKCCANLGTQPVTALPHMTRARGHSKCWAS